MNYMESYKHLDNLCRDMNGIGITGYLNDMEKETSGEWHVLGWKADYEKLRSYRHIRNLIAHQNYADEKSLCSLGDQIWLDEFYKRVMNRKDPLALLYKQKQGQRVSCQRPQSDSRVKSKGNTGNNGDTGNTGNVRNREVPKNSVGRTSTHSVYIPSEVEKDEQENHGKGCLLLTVAVIVVNITIITLVCSFLA